jgi:hypothetical protein
MFKPHNIFEEKEKSYEHTETFSNSNRFDFSKKWNYTRAKEELDEYNKTLKEYTQNITGIYDVN